MDETSHPTPPGPAGSPRRPVVALAIVTAVAVVAAGFTTVRWRAAVGDARELRAEVADLRREVDRLRAEAERDPLGDLLGGLLGDLGGLGDLEGLEDLGSLFGGEGGDLLGGLGLDLAAGCLAEGGLGGLLGGGAEGGAAIPDDDPRAQYAAAAEWVERERGLEFDRVPEPAFVTADEMRARVAQHLRADYPADLVRADQELYEALGVLEPGTDLLATYTEFVGGQVAGYYDPDTGELVVLGDEDEPFDAIELLTIAHELEHALADQALDLPIADEVRTDDPDAQLAGLALVEGDATLTMSRFQLAATDPAEAFGLLLGGDLQRQRQALEDAPPFLAAQLVFPYTEGLSFVCALESDGGWEAVDRAYREPPTTTAQVLFPERYTAGEGAVAVDAPPGPAGGGWERVRTTTFGAADLMFLFEDAGIDDARERAGAWAGGEMTQYRRGEDVAVRIGLAQHARTGGLCDSVRAWADTVDGAQVRCEGDRVSVAIG